MLTPSRVKPLVVGFRRESWQKGISFEASEGCRRRAMGAIVTYRRQVQGTGGPLMHGLRDQTNSEWPIPALTHGGISGDVFFLQESTMVFPTITEVVGKVPEKQSSLCTPNMSFFWCLLSGFV